MPPTWPALCDLSKSSLSGPRPLIYKQRADTHSEPFVGSPDAKAIIHLSCGEGSRVLSGWCV